MSDVFIVSDTHFSHANFLLFKKPDGTFVRNFKSVQDMDDTMRANWNSIVKPDDKVYHLGDVAMHKHGLQCLKGLNGRKILIKGNHDTAKLDDYAEYFKDIRSCHILGGAILSHIPVHVMELGRFQRNLHGHTHHLFVPSYMDGDHSGSPDPRYRNMCVEQTNYTPVPLEIATKDWTV